MTATESLTSPVPSPRHATEHLPTTGPVIGLTSGAGVAVAPSSTQFPVTTDNHQQANPTPDTHNQSGDDVSVWAPGLRLGIGVVVILLGLWWSLHLTPAIDQVGYIPTMFAYLIVMIIGGALMITGATTLWTRISTPTDAEQAK